MDSMVCTVNKLHHLWMVGTALEVKLYIKEFNVAKAWSKCESGFCAGGGSTNIFQSTLKVIAFSHEEAIAYGNPGREIDNWHEEDQQSAFHCPHELSITDYRSGKSGLGAENYAALLYPCE